MKALSGILAVFLVVFAGAGCGGAKVLKEPQPVERTEPLMVAADDDLAVVLVWIIVRDGPGTWAKNADWDEYRFYLQNRAEDTIRITDISVIDSIGHPAAPSGNREDLVKASRETKERYGDEDLEVKAGLGAGRLFLTSTAVTAGVAAATIGTTSGGMFMSSAGAATMATLIVVPVIAVFAITRSVNNNKVAKEIAARHTAPPFDLPAGGEAAAVLFYPLSPSPQRIEIVYEVGGNPKRFTMDTSVLLDGLHLVPDE